MSRRQTDWLFWFLFALAVLTCLAAVQSMNQLLETIQRLPR